MEGIIRSIRISRKHFKTYHQNISVEERIVAGDIPSLERTKKGRNIMFNRLLKCKISIPSIFVEASLYRDIYV